jgi:hypothetical protein
MAISLAILAGWGLSASGQQVAPLAPTPMPPAPVTTNVNPAESPKTQWSRFPDAPVTTPTVPMGVPTSLPALPTSSPAAAAAQPGIVPKTLTFQKPAGEVAPTPPTFIPAPASPVLPVPAIPTAMLRNQDERKTAAEREPDKKVADKKDEKKKDEEKDKEKKYSPPSAPSRSEIFRFSNDAELNDRIRSQLKNTKDKFPEMTSLSEGSGPYVPKTASYPPMQTKILPSYIVHRRLYFEEMNAERAGWDLGVIQPFVSAAYFSRDVFLLPHNIGSGLWKNRWDTNIGKCPPGAPTPYYLYPHGFTPGGVLLFATFYTGLPFIFP